MKLFVAIAAAAATCTVAQDIPERDFKCGGEIEYFCGDSHDPHTCLQEHRHELGHDCIFAILEHEALHCGIEVELECGQDRHDRDKFRECIKEHYEQFKKICPEETHFDRFDEIENIKCGAELALCCEHEGGCKTQREKSRCVNGLEHATAECAIAIHEEKDFVCGIETEYACGEYYERPEEFIHCIEEKKPCAEL